MFPTRKSNNLINKFHERLLRLITTDQNSSFETLLQNITMHQKNLQVLMTEAYKADMGEELPIVENVLFLRKSSQY